ncbi:MAG TPA: hypothetical protein VNY05_10220 [Candidatus Acidoferrales bacterium]|nr:hypothetical protein [Candidatus Acidoferrales bacterium]
MKSNTITEPVLGSVFDAQTKTIRVLMGIPAAARVGDSMDTGTPLVAVAISSQRAYALAVEAGTGAALLVSQSGRQVLPGVRAGALQTAVSPRGTAAALYFGDSGKALILTGMPDAPQILREVTLDGPPSVLAVSDDGAGLAAVVSLTANNATVFSYTPQGPGQALLSANRFPSLEFVPGSPTLLMATDTAVYLYQASQGLQLLTDQRDGIAAVVGAAASGDGTQVFIAMQSGQVAVRDVAAATQTMLSCSCVPAGMWRLRGKAVFRLNELGDGPVWLVDGGAAEPRILFVAVPAGDNQ